MRAARPGGSRAHDPRAGLLLLALIAGALLNWGVVAGVLGARDRLPPACEGGPASPLPTGDNLVYAEDAALLFSRGNLARPRVVADYRRQPVRATPGSSPSPAAAATPVRATAPVPVPPSAAVPASPSPAPPEATFLAAALAPDQKSMLFLVVNAPDRPGAVSLRLTRLDPPAASPVEVWSGPARPNPTTAKTSSAAASISPGGSASPFSASGPTSVHPTPTPFTTSPESAAQASIQWLGDDKALLKVPFAFAPPEASARLVAVAAITPKPGVVESGPENAYLSGLHASWPETKGLPLEAALPAVAHRVLGPAGVVGGIQEQEQDRLFFPHRLRTLVVGREGQANVTPVCALRASLTPRLFSPDGRYLDLSGAGQSYVLDVAGGRAATFLLRGDLLDWRLQNG